MPRRAHPPLRTSTLSSVGALAALVVAALVVVVAFVAPFASPARAAATVVVQSDFEDGLDGWGARGSSTVSLSTENPRGSQSLLVTGRTESWNGAALPVTLTPGVTYSVSLWLRLPSTGTGYADLRVSVQRDDANGSSYDTVATATGVTSGAWTQVTASYTPGPFDTAQLYVESPSSLTDILVDDVVVTGSGPRPT
ncbi:MAG: carbohydrate binding domain-containing protein [Cellulomonas sp.]|uniref:carbohydrate binding domain-containing protein n=1 Tax=Cellulomonas sp. TaxID=40001 RepID=UPI00258AD3F6|nr:carbohydrate binding domain-containing protein [Cellulomonas sp.]MCR6705777.1 carbohydrate binding domain-containing protein [Cellulomonas sp.]